MSIYLGVAKKITWGTKWVNNLFIIYVGNSINRSLLAVTVFRQGPMYLGMAGPISKTIDSMVAILCPRGTIQKKNWCSSCPQYLKNFFGCRDSKRTKKRFQSNEAKHQARALGD